MASAIDPALPADGRPARKSDLRANLAAAKAEIEALERARTYISLLEFGAVGDGETDDTAAVQAAVDHAAAAGNRSAIWIPRGTFLTGQVNLYETVTIQGEGHHSVVRSKPGEHLFRWRDAGEPDFLPWRGWTALRAFRIELDCSVDIRASSGLISVGGERIGVCALLFPKRSTDSGLGVESQHVELSGLRIEGHNGEGNGSCAIFDQRALYNLRIAGVACARLAHGYMASLPGLRPLGAAGFDAATDTVTLAGHGYGAGERIAFTWRAEVAGPGGLIPRRTWYTVTDPTADTFRLTDRDGNAVDVTSAPDGEVVVGPASASTLDWAPDDCHIGDLSINATDTVAVFCNVNSSSFSNFSFYAEQAGPRFLNWPTRVHEAGGNVQMMGTFAEGPYGYEAGGFPGDYLQWEWHQSSACNLGLGGGLARVTGHDNRFEAFTLAHSGYLRLEGHRNEVTLIHGTEGHERVIDVGYHNRVRVGRHGDGSKRLHAPYQVGPQTLMPAERGGWSPGFLRTNPADPYQNDSALFAHGPALTGEYGFGGYRLLSEDGLAPQGFVRIPAANTASPLFSGWLASNKPWAKWRIGSVVPPTRGLLYLRMRAAAPLSVEVQLEGQEPNRDASGQVPCALTTAWRIFEIPYDFEGQEGGFATLGIPAPARPWGVDVDLHWVALVPHPQRAIGRALWLKDGVPAPTGPVPGMAQIYIDEADGALKVRFANGVVKTVTLS